MPNQSDELLARATDLSAALEAFAALGGRAHAECDQMLIAMKGDSAKAREQMQKIRLLLGMLNAGKRQPSSLKRAIALADLLEQAFAAAQGGA